MTACCSLLKNKNALDFLCCVQLNDQYFVFHLLDIFPFFFKIQADVDNSGTIDYGEFIAAMLHLNKVQKEDHLFAAFNYFDKDGSGYITKDELQQACNQFGLQEDHLDDIIREADRDNVMDLNFFTSCFFNITFTHPVLSFLTSFFLSHHVIHYVFQFCSFYFSFYLNI